MNAFPPMPPFFPSQHRFPGHHTPRPARERTQIGTIILPPEALLAQRIFAARPLEAPVAGAQRPAAATPAPQPTRQPGPLARLVGLLRRLVGHA